MQTTSAVCYLKHIKFQHRLHEDKGQASQTLLTLMLKIRLHPVRQMQCNVELIRLKGTDVTMIKLFTQACQILSGVF